MGIFKVVEKNNKKLHDDDEKSVWSSRCCRRCRRPLQLLYVYTLYRRPAHVGPTDHEKVCIIYIYSLIIVISL